MRKDMKAITVDPEIRDMLNKLKRYQKETYNEVIRKLIENQKDEEPT